MKGKKVFTFHSILGLITGILLLVISLSGCILVFSDEIDLTLNTQIIQVKPQSGKASLDTIFANASRDFPTGFIRFRKLPQHPDQSIEVSVENKGEWTFAYYNPYTGKLIGSRDARTYFMGWLLLFHYSLLGGILGELLVGILSITLVLSIITGIIVYRKHFLKVLLFKVPFNFSNWRKASSSLHRIVGVWTLAFNLVFAITGFWMLRYVFLPDTYQTVEEASVQTNFQSPISLDSAINFAITNFSGFLPSAILMPETKDSHIRIYGKVAGQNPLFDEHSNFIDLDADTLKEVRRLNIAEQNVSEKWEGIDFNLHSGHWGNLFVKILYCLVGLSPGLLSITGFLLWYRRKRKAFLRS